MLRVERISASTMSISDGSSSVEIGCDELPRLIRELQSAICGSAGVDLFGAVTVPSAIVAADIARDFETWWRQYPKKAGKGAARKAYERVVKSGKATPQELLAGLARYNPDPKFTKHPATWLNAECWLDEPEKPGSAIRSGSAAMGILNIIAEQERA